MSDFDKLVFHNAMIDLREHWYLYLGMLVAALVVDQLLKPGKK